MQKKFLKISNLIFCQKWVSGVALPRPSGRPNIPGKLKNLGHTLLDAKGILKKDETLVAFIRIKQLTFAQKWVWPCHAPQYV